MHMSRRTLVVALLAGLGGCGPGDMPRVAPAPGLLAQCGADRLIGLIGLPVADLPAQPATRSLRILRPGDPVTEDFNPSRLNVILDAGDHISAVSCG